MKRTTQTLLGAAVAVLSLAASAQQGPYMGLHVGVNDLSSWSNRVDFGAGVVMDGRTTVDHDFHWGILAGRQFGAWRAELEYEQGTIDVNAVTLGPISSPEDASGSYRAFLVNGYRSFELTPVISAYVGAGIGWGRTKLPALASLAGCNCYAAGSGNGGVWQLRAGVEYEIVNAGHLFVQYTYLRVPAASADSLPAVHYGRKEIGAATLGLRRMF